MRANKDIKFLIEIPSQFLIVFYILIAENGKKLGKLNFPLIESWFIEQKCDETYNPNVGFHVLARMYAHSTVFGGKIPF